MTDQISIPSEYSAIFDEFKEKIQLDTREKYFGIVVSADDLFACPPICKKSDAI